MPIESSAAQTLLKNIDHPVFLTDPDGVIRSVNAPFESFLQGSPDEVIGRSAAFLEAPGSPGPAWDERLENLPVGENWEGIVLHRYRNEEVRRVHQTITPIEDESGAIGGYVVLNLDLNRLTDDADTFRKEALHDDLTDLPNWHLARDRIRQSLDRLERDPDRGFTLLFFDLDDFDGLVQEYDEAIADRVLETLARRLEENIRPGDTASHSTSTWLGTDEFLILLEDTHEPADAESVIKRLLVVTREPMEVEGHRLQVDATAGIVLSSPEYIDPETMVRDAEAALHRARSDGIDYAFATESMEEELQDHFRMESDLRNALKEGEFELHYQPIVHLASGGLEGFEALIRWDHPRGLRTPDEFLPVAERSGLIVPLGQWVLEEALGQFRDWREEELLDEGTVMSVNHSPSELAEQNFLDTVEDVLSQVDLPRESLHLEFRETTVTHNVERMDERIRNLSELGLNLCLDDFGSGLSSLERVSRWPVDYLKIDRTFIKGLGEDEEQRDLTRGVLKFAASNNLHVIAEGVETEQQHRLLREWDCTAAQGYHYAKPLPADEVEDRLRGARPEDDVWPALENR